MHRRAVRARWLHRADSTGWVPIAGPQQAKEVMRRVDDWLDVRSRQAATSYDAAVMALAWAYSLPPSAERRKRALVLLESAVDMLAEERPTAQLFGGASGTGLLIARTQRLLFGPAGEDLIEAIDELVEEVLATSVHRVEYDLVDGLVGLGIYARGRLPRPWARRAITLIVDELAARAQHLPPRGLAWPSRKSPIHVSVALPAGERFFDTGLAHGSAGVCAWLASVAALNPPGIGGLLRGGGAWLAGLLEECHRSNVPLPRFVSERGWGPPAPLGWCYGVTSCAVALMQVAEVTRQPALRTTAELALLGATDAPELLDDAAFCHGSAGLMHICNRLGQTFSSQALQARARRWLERTLALCNPADRTAGSVAVEPVTDALLTGELGKVLALTATISEVEPSWDTLLLLPNQELLR